ncbi:MAG: CDP-diacylglycerol--glycerol-3-phosphate 3-phosphatidyltransferase [Deltaproteobacteria bacterium]|nr:CDP-diacylglycerol--glycerol-3-phosphate 3-phosphatidyltransferase [Deltaproteobacteria bacterium]
MNVPNFFSILRIVSIPLFIILVSYQRYEAAFVVFGFAAVTDAVDGFLARVLKQQTVLGAYLDPIADKLLLISAFIAFALLGLMPRWLAILVVSRDVMILVGILLLRLCGYLIEIRPSILSKCTTVMQILAVGLTLLLHVLHKSSAVLTMVLWVTGILTIVSGIHYIWRAVRIVNDNNNIYNT